MSERLTAEQRAEAIAVRHIPMVSYPEETAKLRDLLAADVVAAITEASKAPPGHVIDEVGTVQKVLERAGFVDGVTWGLKPGQEMVILEAALSPQTGGGK